MPFESVITFWQKVQGDNQLQEQINPASGKVPRLHAGVRQSELVALSEIAKRAGFSATPEEFAAAESVIRFWNKVQTDHGLQEALRPVEKITSMEVAGDEVARIGHAAGFRFSGQQLNAVTAALVEGGRGAGGTSSGSQSAYEQSFRMALLGGWTAPFRYKTGPGAVAEYM